MCDSFKPLSYEQALKRLLQSTSTPKLGLSRISALLAELGDPQKQFKSIHVAGTNGKGSTCAFLSALFQQHYATVGKYISPHLLCARERIQLNDQLIDEQSFCEAEAMVDGASKRVEESPSFFERITAMAFWVFAQKKVDIAIIEVGLGGRFDATNVILPLVSVITNVSKDHQHILGDTIAKIAFEKAGIIKKEVPVITGWQEDAAAKTIDEIAKEMQAPLLELSLPYSGQLRQLGEHQRTNAAFAIAALDVAGVCLSDAKVEMGLSKAVTPCRLDFFQGNPPILIDGAHNEASIEALVREISNHEWFRERPIILILGMTRGHDIDSMAKLIFRLSKRIEKIYLTRSGVPRSLDPSELKEYFLDGVVIEKSTSALKKAKEEALAKNALIVITGSLYLCGEARAQLTDMPSDPSFPIY